MQKSKRGVVLRILEQAKRLLKRRYGHFSPFDKSTHGKHVGISSALFRAMEFVEDADDRRGVGPGPNGKAIGEYKEYLSTANNVIDYVQRRVLATDKGTFWETDERNQRYGEEAKKRLFKILDTAIRVIKEDDKRFA